MSDTPDPDLLRRVEEAMLNIPKLQREIFMAHRLDDLPYEEIAHRTQPRRPLRIDPDANRS